MIKEKRKSKKYTHEQMSNRLGISLRQYVRIDNVEIREYIRKMTENIT